MKMRPAEFAPGPDKARLLHAVEFGFTIRCSAGLYQAGISLSGGRLG